MHSVKHYELVNSIDSRPDDMICIHDARKRYVDYNKNFRRSMLQIYNVKMKRKKTMAELFTDYPEDVKRADAQLERCLRKETFVVTEEYGGVQYETRYSPIMSKGKVEGAVLCIRMIKTGHDRLTRDKSFRLYWNNESARWTLDAVLPVPVRKSFKSREKAEQFLKTYSENSLSNRL